MKAMRVIAQRDGLFGPVRIKERQRDKARLYCIHGSVQTMTQPSGVSLFGYIHAAKLLVREAETILIIGGGGGSLANMLARQGRQVTVIDVDPVAEELARAFFDLDERVLWRTAEPFAFLSDHRDKFDAVVVDACNADGLAAPFDRADVLFELVERACPQGSLVLNLVHEDGAPPGGGTLARQLVERGLSATLYRADDGWEGNEVLHVRKAGATDTLEVTDPERRPAETRTYLMSLRAHTAHPKRKP
jgi:spermidine synthase